MSDTQAALFALISEDPAYIYSEEELDQIEALDMEVALRIARAQHLAQQDVLDEPEAYPAPELSQVEQGISAARDVLAQDGGDIELVALEGRLVRVRMKGACAGCPNSALDLRIVVHKLVREHAPGVVDVVNMF